MRWAYIAVLASALSCGQEPPDDVGTPSDDPAVFDDLGPLRRLTTWELENILVRALDLPHTESGFSKLPYERTTPFDNNSATQVPQLVYLEAVEAMATELSAELVEDPDRFAQVVGCHEAACLPDFVGRFGESLWRRALEEDEIDMLVAASSDLPDATFEEQVAFLASAMMQDPAFLYIVELGTPDVAPSGRRWLSTDEIEARLALFMLGASPVGELFPPDTDRDLRDPAQRVALADALLTDRRARTVVARFHSQWMGYATSLPREAAHDMRLQADAMIHHIVFDEPQPWTELFRTSETWMHPRLHELYALPGDPVEGWVDLDLEDRRGLLSWGAFLSVGGRAAQTSPTLRGKLVAERFACDPVPPPPPTVDADSPPDGEPGSCKVDRYERHRTDPGCASCHDQLDGVGMGLEGFDALGRTRTHELDEVGQIRSECPVPTEGELPGVGTFSGPAELAELLLGDESMQRCMVEHFLQWAGRRGRESEDDNDAALLTADWLDDGADFRQLMLDHVARDAFAQVGDP